MTDWNLDSCVSNDLTHVSSTVVPDELSVLRCVGVGRQDLKDVLQSEPPLALAVVAGLVRQEDAGLQQV